MPCDIEKELMTGRHEKLKASLSSASVSQMVKTLRTLIWSINSL